MFSPPKKRADLAAWWSVAGKAGKSTLLVVSDDDYFVATSHGVIVGPGSSDDPFAEVPRIRNRATMLLKPVVPEPFLWPPEDARSIPGLSRLAVQVVTLDELALLLADAGLPDVQYTRGNPLRFLLHDGRGFRIAELSGGQATTARLAEAIAQVDPGIATKIFQPAVRGASTATGGKKNANP
jgi:hypothetical protein